MAVWKSEAELFAADGMVIGRGRAYLHLRQPASAAQPAQGTLSLDWWDETRSPIGATLQLRDGPALSLHVQGDTLRGCVEGRILRYTADWPGR